MIEANGRGSSVFLKSLKEAPSPKVWYIPQTKDTKLVLFEKGIYHSFSLLR